MSETTTPAERAGGCACGCGAGHEHGGHEHGGRGHGALPDIAGRRSLGLTSARPGEGTDPAALAQQGPRPGGGCACGRH
ncbi:hypothetical protein [Georgenia ruanii]|uniref:hypothetical protein n=1 Tax=Georgenia ruanii TaxID=348442 RepID=UPI00126592D1|nr:hypothetical protein [Georgenia ruanii]